MPTDRNPTKIEIFEETPMADRQTYHKRYVSPDGQVVTEVFSETVTDDSGDGQTKSSHRSVRVEVASTGTNGSASSSTVSSSSSSSSSSHVSVSTGSASARSTRTNP
jgi:hypothetical protein